jgi:hypothetical protein
MTIGSELMTVRGAELVDGNVIWPGSDPRRQDLTIPQRVWRFIGPSPLRLGHGERFVLATRRHWLVPVKDMTQMGAGWAAAFIAGWVLDVLSVGVWWLKLAVWVSVVVHQVMMCHQVLAWRAELIVVTNHQWIVVKGVFSSRVERIPLVRMTGLTVTQSYVQRLLGFGSILIESGGRHNDPSYREEEHYVPDPHGVAQAVEEWEWEWEWEG